jgi:hypothetical protein
MSHRPLRRAIALSLGALLAFAGGAAADSARADGDVVAPMIQARADLGQVAPGAVRTVDIGFVLTCTGTTHLDAGQTVTFAKNGAVVPLGGEIISVGNGSLGPLPVGWPVDGADCDDPAQTYSGGSPSVVTLRAPTTSGPHTYTLQYVRSFSPFGADDPGAIRQGTGIEIHLVVNTPPTLSLPAAATGGTIEANTTGGWTADWSGLGATDAEDAPDPTPTCAPAAGTVLPLGPTTVACGVTDVGGLSANGSFVVTVVDKTAPTLGDVPADQSLTTGDPTGTTITYTPPGATDIADAQPTVDCLPASGSHVGLGTTTVTCTATDASGNASQAAFAVNVAYVAPHVASARWGAPIAGFESAFIANRGRTIPVKVELLWDGGLRNLGVAHLTITPCIGGAPVASVMTYGGGRWNVAVDTASLAGSCHTVTAWLDGLEAGAFRLELRGTEPVRALSGKR